MSRLVLILFILILDIVGQVEAQEESTSVPVTLVPTSSVVYQETASVVFPQALFFQFVVDVPANQISVLRLVIDLPNQEPQIIDLDPFDAEITDPFTELEFFWELPQNNQVRLFEDINYRWQVVTLSEDVIESSGIIDYRDTRVDWITDTDTQGRLDITYPAGRFSPSTMRGGTDDLLNLLYPNNTAPTLNILVYPEELPFGCNQDLATGDGVFVLQFLDESREFPCDSSYADRALQNSNFILIQVANEAEFRDRIADVVTEFYYDDLWQGVDVPIWFEQGLVTFYEPGGKSEFLLAAQQADRTNQIFSYNEMLSIPDDATERELWDIQSFGMVLYMADTIGVEGLFGFARNLQGAESFEANYQSAMGQPLASVVQAWRSWLFRQSTADAYLFHPYLAPTPTPSSTPTATWTPTITTTPSPTDDIPPTIRPSNTPRPPTATVTPLPAQGFSVRRTPTPTPVVPEQTVTAPSPEIGVVLVGFGAVFVLLILLISRLSNRRNR